MIKAVILAMPHSSILDGLTLQGSHYVAIQLIGNMYRDTFTSFCDVTSISIKRGFKQGEPLSPLLFNLALDLVLHGLKSYNRGREYENLKLKIIH
jgi:hypothetical protein